MTGFKTILASEFFVSTVSHIYFDLSNSFIVLFKKGALSINIRNPGGGRFVKKTSRKYNLPLIKNNLRYYFYFLPVRVSNILKF